MIMHGIWGEMPSASVEASLVTYAKFGKFGIFGADIHRILGPTGIAGQIKDASDAVASWAQTTKFAKLALQARDAFAPLLSDDSLIIDDMTIATLFAGLGGTTDMTLKCIINQKRDPAHERLFKQDPEKYLIELMRMDSAVTSVTELFRDNMTMNLGGRDVNLAKGTPAQLVLTTANRDPTHWDRPDAFDPDRKDLRDTLSWNGKAADAEARSLDNAPRHCPGHCLSLK